MTDQMHEGDPDSRADAYADSYADSMADVVDQAAAEVEQGIFDDEEFLAVVGDEFKVQLRSIVAREMARQAFDEEKRKASAEEYDTAGKSLMSTSALDGFLSEEAVPVTWALEDVLLDNGKLLVIAQAKSGKTTLVTNLVKSLADEVPFLGTVATGSPMPGKIVVLDAEMPKAKLQEMYAAIDVTNKDKIIVHALRDDPLRSLKLRLTDEDTQLIWISHLREVGASTWIIDPVADVFKACGNMDEDKADSWLALQEAVDTIAIAAGVSVRGLVHHSGWDGSRGRGSSRQYDWPDTIVELRREGDGANPSVPRKLRVWGRGVDIPDSRVWRSTADEVTLTLDPTTIGSAAPDPKDAAVAGEAAIIRRCILEVLAHEKKEPSGKLMSKNRLFVLVNERRQEITGRPDKLSKQNAFAAIDRAYELHDDFEISAVTGRGGTTRVYSITPEGEATLAEAIVISE